MINLIKVSFTICLAILFTAFDYTGDPKTKIIDPQTSTIDWTGKKIIGSHMGSINVKEAYLVFTDGNLTDGKIIIDMTSISNTDLKGDSKVSLEGHLMSADFFDVQNYPEASLKIMRVAPGDESGQCSIAGDLTIKGQTNVISFPAQITEEGATAKIIIDRTKYDIKYGSSNFFDDLGDKAIDNKFTLMVDLKFAKE